MQKGDFIEISYTGKIKENGSIFDKGDVIIALGRNMILPPLEKYLLEMNVGERKNVNVSPEEAFGKRNENLIKTIPLSEFKKHNTNPYPGMIISADNMQGRVLSINGGRVTVDFNHPLAGKYLNYDIE
ncbi:MAG: peptidylprolyl isomerase, partial [Candidatus Aenigmatarchaeota archaeon]